VQTANSKEVTVRGGAVRWRWFLIPWPDTNRSNKTTDTLPAHCLMWLFISQL